MYNEYFGFAEKPFHIAPDLNFLFLSPKHKGALACMEYGFMGDMGVVLITGDIGTGKTTLVRLFLRKLPENARTASIFNTNVTPEQLLSLVVHEFGFARQGENKALLVESIQAGLQQLHAANLYPVLIIDDAQNLSLEALEEVRWLCNLQSENRNLVQIILVGQPELRTKLQKPVMASLAQRIGVNYHLRPFTRDEAGEYIVHRLKTVNGKADLFSKAAVDLIFESARGIPRVINLLCDSALVYAFADEHKKIDTSIVEQVLTEMYPQGLWDLPSGSVGIHMPDPSDMDSERQSSDLDGPEQKDGFQKMERLLETLEQQADNYVKELRAIFKLLLKKEQQRFNQLSTEYLRLKTITKALQKGREGFAERPEAPQPKNAAVPQKGKGVVVKLVEPK
ncbi:MAG: hypothetical protein C4519_01260 [Desulfobacteraceae bacterium]|nr:MAG: hypothetical protein C4519_01260 [Desulfobacteraceae bacterium]